MSNKSFYWDKFGESSTFWSLSRQGVNRLLMGNGVGIGLGPEWKKTKNCGNFYNYRWTFLDNEQNRADTVKHIQHICLPMCHNPDLERPF